VYLLNPVTHAGYRRDRKSHNEYKTAPWSFGNFGFQGIEMMIGKCEAKDS